MDLSQIRTLSRIAERNSRILADTPGTKDTMDLLCQNFKRVSMWLKPDSGQVGIKVVDYDYNRVIHFYEVENLQGEFTRELEPDKVLSQFEHSFEDCVKRNEMLEREALERR